MSLTALAAVALAAVLDWLFGEFPERVHPVALFGRLAGAFDREWVAPRLAGAVVALALPLFAAAVVGGVVLFAVRAHPAAGALVAGLALFATTSRRMLLDVAREVVDLTGDDGDALDAARERLPALAGRDASGLSAGQVRSAAVESAAENLADGLVGPLVAFGVGALFGLPVAAGAAAWVKGVNTLDSMLGYRAKPVGWASARLDDVVMYVPARASAALLALAARDPDALVDARAWADEPPSPNSGWPMATIAAVLRVRLEKPGVDSGGYVLNPVGALPDVEQARRGLSVVGRAGLIAYLGAGVLALVAPGSGRTVAGGRALATALEVLAWS